MGQAAAAIPYIIAAVGAGASYYNTQKVASQKDEELARNLRNQAEVQRKADKKTHELVDKVGESEPDAFRNNALNQFMTQLQASQAGANAGLVDVTGASDAFKAGNKDAQLGVSDYAKQTADLVSRMDAPQQQRRREGQIAANYGSEIDRIKRISRGDDFLSRMRLDGITRNPLIDAFATMAQSYASNSTGGYSGG